MGSTQSTLISSSSSPSSSSPNIHPKIHVDDLIELRRNMNRYLQPPKSWLLGVKMNSKHVESSAYWDLDRQPGVTFDGNKVPIDQICYSSILLALPVTTVTNWRGAVVTGAYRHDGHMKCKLKQISPITPELLSQLVLPSYRQA